MFFNKKAMEIHRSLKGCPPFKTPNSENPVVQKVHKMSLDSAPAKREPIDRVSNMQPVGSPA